MKTYLYLLILLLMTISSFSQKREVYLNDDLIEISRNEFKETRKKHKFFNQRFELDTIIVNVKVQKIRKGKISKKELDSIKYILSKISSQNIPTKNIIIINYHHGSDSCNSTGNKSFIKKKYKSYLKKLKKNERISQFFMYKSSEGIKQYGKKLNWVKDEFETIEKKFLPLHYPCGSYILIDDNGNYYINKGEHDIEKIIDLLINKKTTFNT